MKKNIKETIILEKWVEDVWKVEGEETWILRELEVLQNMVALIASLHLNGPRSSPSIFTFPRQGVINMNFNRASKGNPTLVVYGVFQDNRENPLNFYAGNCRHTCNNVEKFKAFERGLILAYEARYPRLQIDVDS